MTNFWSWTSMFWGNKSCVRWYHTQSLFVVKTWANHIHPYLTKLLATTWGVLSFDCYWEKREIGKPDNFLLLGIHICDDDRMPSNLHYWMRIRLMKCRRGNRKKSGISELYSLDHERSGKLNEQFDKSWILEGGRQLFFVWLKWHLVWVFVDGHIRFPSQKHHPWSLK